jgi:hypothetical protein
MRWRNILHWISGREGRSDGDLEPTTGHTTRMHWQISSPKPGGGSSSCSVSNLTGPNQGTRRLNWRRESGATGISGETTESLAKDPSRPQLEMPAGSRRTDQKPAPPLFAWPAPRVQPGRQRISQPAGNRDHSSSGSAARSVSSQLGVMDRPGGGSVC